MKRFLTIVVLFSSLISLSGCSGHSDHKEEIKDPVANTESTIAIEGMMCEKGCKSTIQSHLREMNGVMHADVDYEGKKATVSYDNRVISSNDMVEMINKLADGIYKANLIEEKPIEASSGNTTNINNTDAEDEISVSNYDFTLPDFLGIFNEML